MINKPKIWWLVTLLALIFAIWAFSGYVLYDNENRGTFGDMFGAANSLFSGFAFATLIYTIWMQHEELALQRVELELTRGELKGQKEQLKMQSAIFELQRFENTFLELVKVHGEIVNAIDLVNKNGTITKSRDCFKTFYKRLESNFLPHKMYPQEEDHLKIAIELYDRFYEEHQAELGHYFRHLYHILKFVKNSHVNDKKMYSDLIRAQLSSYELALLYYNCISIQGSEKFKPLTEEFSVFKNLSRKLLFLPQPHSEFYSPAAFGLGNKS